MQGNEAGLEKETFGSAFCLLVESMDIVKLNL